MGSITPSIYGLVSTLKLQTWSDAQKLQARQNIDATFVSATNGSQEFSVLRDNGDGYAGFRFCSSSTLNELPTLNVIGSAEEFTIGQDVTQFLLNRFGIQLSSGNTSLSITSSGVAISGLQSFTGTTTPGLQLKSLTTAQINTLASASALPVGSILVDSTTDRIDARLTRGTVELVDTAGGQTIGGALSVSGLLDLRKAATANILQFSTTAFLRTDTSQLSIFDTGLARSNIALWRSGNFVVGSSTLIAASSGVDATGNVVDTSLSRNAAGVWQMGTTAANALGSLLLTNLTASGTVSVGTLPSGPTYGPLNIKTDGSGTGFTIADSSTEFTRFVSGGVVKGLIGSGAVPLVLNSSTVQIRSNNTVAIRNDGSTADGNLSCGNLTASGDINLTGRIVYASSGVPFLRCAGSNVAAVFNNVLRHIQLRGGGEGGLTWASGSDPSGVASSGITQIGAAHLAIGNGTADSTAGSLSLTNLTASGTLRVGGGTVVQTILSATATLDFPSIGSNGTETLTITVTGAVAGDSVFLGCPATLEAGLIFCASVTAADTVTVRMHNSSGGSVNPASGTFRATVVRF